MFVITEILNCLYSNGGFSKEGKTHFQGGDNLAVKFEISMSICHFLSNVVIGI